MKSIVLLGASALALAACNVAGLTPSPVQEADVQALSNAIADAPKPTPDAGPAVVTPAVEVAAAAPLTVSGGSGSTCLAVDVLANNGAFIRRGTAGTLSGDTFTVNGTAHDLSGIPYSIKDC